MTSELSFSKPSSPISILLRTEGWAGRFIGLMIGAIGVLGHPPFHFWPIALLSFAILYGRLQSVADKERSRKRGFSVALWWGLGYFAAGTFWVGSAFIERGPEFIPIMPFMVAGLALLLAIFWAFAGGFFASRRVSGVWAVVIFAAVFTLAEFMRGHIFGGFPWNLPAYIFEAGSRPSQIARWTGAYGLSTLVLLLGGALGQAIFWRGKRWPVLMVALPLMGMYLLGHLRLSNAELEYHDDVRIRIVSVPFKQSEMMSFDSSIGITNKFITASVAPGIKDVTHVVWPEGAVRGFNGPAVDNPDLLNAVGRAFSNNDSTPPVWLMNSLQTEIDAGRRRYYNASIAITFNDSGIGEIAGFSRKKKLVAFGEHIPLMDWFEDVQFPLISTNLASISPAERKTLVDFPGLPRVSPQLCYEVVFPAFTPLDRQNPAQFILNQSNDAWFGPSVGPAQHANTARYRALEMGLPIIRAASNGMSGLIDPYGRVRGKVVVSETLHFDTDLPKSLKTKKNFLSWQKWRKWWLLISLSLCIISTIIGWRGVGLRR